MPERPQHTTPHPGRNHPADAARAAAQTVLEVRPIDRIGTDEPRRVVTPIQVDGDPTASLGEGHRRGAKKAGFRPPNVRLTFASGERPV